MSCGQINRYNGFKCHITTTTAKTTTHTQVNRRLHESQSVRQTTTPSIRLRFFIISPHHAFKTGKTSQLTKPGSVTISELYTVT